MSKVKRILSVIMAIVMVLAMSVPTFAAGTTATVSLTGFEDADSAEYMQIIKPDTSKTSGWAFTNGAGVCFTSALGLTDSDDAQQQVIWGLIQYRDSTVALPTGVTAKTVTAADIDLALSKVKALTGFINLTDKTKFDVDKAGVYAIKAEEEGYTYKTATAYVGFGEVEHANYPALLDTRACLKNILSCSF